MPAYCTISQGLASPAPQIRPPGRAARPLRETAGDGAEVGGEPSANSVLLLGTPWNTLELLVYVTGAVHSAPGGGGGAL